MDTNLKTAQLTAEDTCANRHPAPARSFSQVTRVARGLGIGFRPGDDPDLAEGVLTDGEGSYRVALSYQPESSRLRLLVRVAHLKSMPAQLATHLLRLQASSGVARFVWDDEADPSLLLDATAFCPPDTNVVPHLVRQVFEDIERVLWDPHLKAQLEIAGARSCARTTLAWNDD